MGAGCGPAGIAAGILGAAHVVLTDLPYTLPVLNANIQLNQHQIENKIDCQACDRYRPPPLSALFPNSRRISNNYNNNNNNDYDADAISSGEQLQLHCPDVILLADCVWLEELVEPLFQTIDKFCCSTSTNVIITYQQRGKSTHVLFLKHLHSTFETVERIDTKVLFGRYIPDYLYLFVCHK